AAIGAAYEQALAVGSVDRPTASGVYGKRNWRSVRKRVEGGGAADNQAGSLGAMLHAERDVGGFQTSIGLLPQWFGRARLGRYLLTRVLERISVAAGSALIRWGK